MKIMDSVEFLHDMVLPVVKNVNKKDNIVLHPVCSLEKMGTWSKFVSVARFFADSVTVPANAGCCGMAGDRGFLFPELTASATAKEAEEVNKRGMMDIILPPKPVKLPCRMLGKDYESILYLVDEALNRSVWHKNLAIYPHGTFNL